MFKPCNSLFSRAPFWRWLLLVALALSLTAMPNTARADGPITSDFFSMDDGGVTSLDPNLTALARATGAPLLRMSLYWKFLEPNNTTPENYNWDYPDEYFARAFDANLTPLVYVAENPSWAANTACGPIDTTNETLRAEFAEFMGAVAARYPQIKRWGLYNESDGSKVLLHTGGCFGDSNTGDLNNNHAPDYAEYAEMAGIARDAVHQANPDAQVYIAVAFDDFDTKTCPPDYPGGCPGVSHFNYNFLPNLFGYMASHPRPNGQPYADALAFTYYDIYGPYWERQPSGAGTRGIQAKAAAIRQRLTDAGVSLALFVTETGNDSQVNGQDGQSRCLTISHVRGMASSLQMIVWWTFVDNPVRHWYYGLVDTGQNVKPSYTAYQTLFNQLNGWTYVKRWTKNNSVEAYQFTDTRKKQWVAWSNLAVSNGKSPCAYPRQTTGMNFRAKRLRVTDLYGNSKIVRDNRAGDSNPRKGRIRIALDGSPQYVVINP